MMESCCTCAAILSPNSPPPSSKSSPISEKPLPENRRVDCCDRIICGKCIHNNRRFADYCPYCQISTAPTSLPQRLKDPPSYANTTAPGAGVAEDIPPPPPYTAAAITSPSLPVDDEKAALAEQEKPADDTLHFLNHEHDSITSLSLRYGVPAGAFRRANNITSDHLLGGRRTVVIPGEFYKGGVSLSPRPIEGEEEELRKNKIRRFMTSCKVSDYDVAVLYLQQSSYDLDDATEKYIDDEAWEKAHPAESRPKRKIGEASKQKNRGPFWRGS